VLQTVSGARISRASQRCCIGSRQIGCAPDCTSVLSQTPNRKEQPHGGRYRAQSWSSIAAASGPKAHAIHSGLDERDAVTLRSVSAEQVTVKWWLLSRLASARSRGSGAEQDLFCSGRGAARGGGKGSERMCYRYAVEYRQEARCLGGLRFYVAGG